MMLEVLKLNVVFLIILLFKRPQMSDSHCTEAILKIAFKFPDNCSTWIRDVLVIGGSL